MAKITKQRQESAYEEGGRIDLAEQELGEIAIIEDFLPRQLDEDEIAQAIESAIAQAGAESLRDMGRVMAQLKSNYAGQMDFGSVGQRVKDMLSG